MSEINLYYPDIKKSWEDANVSIDDMMFAYTQDITDLQARIAKLEERDKTLRIELHTLRLKESQEQRFIWWIWNVYSKNVMDTVAAIIHACTYQDEPTAAAGKYGLPIKCFDMMRRLTESSHGIYDGTYLDVEISVGVKNTNPDYYNHAKTSTDNNKGE